MKKILSLVLSLAILISCKMSVNDIANKPNSEKQTTISPKTKIKHGGSNGITLPTNDTEQQAITIRESHSIVKTVVDFDGSIFEKFFDTTVEGEMDFSDGYKYFFVKSKNEAAACNLRKILETAEGVVYSQSDYVRILPPVRGKINNENAGVFSIVDNGDLDKDGDPIGFQEEYALRITKARNWYDENGTPQDGAYKKYGYGENEVVVAIIDTGLNQLHKDFDGVLLYGKSAFDTDGITEGKLRVVDVSENFDKGSGHGTHCSGTICAKGENGKGIAGVAFKNTKLISYKGLSDKGSGSWQAIYGGLGDLAEIVTILRKDPNTRTSAEKAKIPTSVPNDFQINQKTVPVNMSLGGGSMDPFSVEMINKALAAGVLPVIAMGNEGRTITASPAIISGVCSVGATTAYDTKANFSDSGTWINICAPGHNIISTGNFGPDTYQYMSGTSMATPFITGVFAYLLSFDEARDLTPYQLITLLEKTADKISSPNEADFKYDSSGYSKYYGYGRVNVLKAVEYLKTKKIPAENERYSENPVTFVVNNTASGSTEPLSGQKVYVYETNSNICTAVGITDAEGKVFFWGLKSGVKYVAKILFFEELKEIGFTPNSGSGEYTFEFTKNLCFISTCENRAYDEAYEPYKLAGLPKPWLNVILFDKDKNEIAYAGGFYPKLVAEVEPGAAYYVVIVAWADGAKYEGGNYGLYIGRDYRDFIRLYDNGRTNPLANDTHEDNNTFDEADKKFSDMQNAAPNGYWEREIPGNLLPQTPNTGNDFSDKGDVDIYKFIMP